MLITALLIHLTAVLRPVQDYFTIVRRCPEVDGRRKPTAVYTVL